MPIDLPPDSPKIPIGGPSPSEKPPIGQAIQFSTDAFMAPSNKPLKASDGAYQEPVTPEGKAMDLFQNNGEIAAEMGKAPLGILANAPDLPPPPPR